jgi:hypothetical protein
VHVTPLLPLTRLIEVDFKELEFDELPDVSIFSLPKFDSKRQMKALQGLWIKQQLETIALPNTPQVSMPSMEYSFFEMDGESDEEEELKWRYIPFVSLADC